MKGSVAYPSTIAGAFRLEDAPSLVTRALHTSTISVTELKYNGRNFGLTDAIPRQDAYLIALQCRACSDHDLYFDGRLTRPRNFAAGVTTIFDLRTSPVADLRDPFHSLMFHLPRKALNAVAEQAGVRPAQDLRHDPGVSVVDPVVRHLLSSLLPAIAKPAGTHCLFLDSVSLALIVHLAQRYGGMNPPAQRGGLTRSQERRAKDLLTADLREHISLAHLAAECGLSVRHFGRAFLASTGIPPHRWLLRHRVSRAKELLMNRRLSIAEVAITCGFADQSHFTRVFTAHAGISPAAWQRENASLVMSAGAAR